MGGPKQGMRACFIGAIIAIALVGCSGQHPEKNRIALCKTIGKLVGDLAPYRSEMSEKQVATVNAVREVTDPICLSDTAPDTMTIYDGFQKAVLELVEVHGEVTQ